MKTHKFDALSFISGLLITGLGLMFLLLPETGDIIDFLADSGSWLWPVLLIGVGIGVLAPLATRRGQREEETDS